MAYLGKTPSQAVRSRYYYTAAGSETSLSGADDNNNTLIFTDGNYVDVYLNGVLLVSDTDYNTTTTNTISGLAALAANDIVEIVVYDTFSVFGGEVKGDFNVTNGTLTADFEGTFTFQAKNASGAGIAKGTPVYISGHSGNSAEIAVADANDPAKMPSFGIAAEAIGNNLTGKVVSYGNLKEIDTSAFAVGDSLYVSNTGTLTATRPSGTSDEVQKVAKVIRSHASVGQLFVMGAGRTNDIPNFTSNSIQFADNAKAIFGTGSDLQIYHDGSQSYITDTGTGSLRVRAEDFILQNADGSNAFLYADAPAGAVLLYHNGSQKFQTTSTGIDVTGTVTADGILNNNKSEFFASEAALVSTGSTAKVYATNSTFDGVNGSLVLQSRPTSGADVYIATGSTPKTVAKFNDGGDISFYDSTGVTQGLFWDASTQRLGLGTTAPSTKIHLNESGSANAVQRIQAGTNGYAAQLHLYGNNVSGAAYNSVASYVSGDSTPQWEITGPEASAEDQMLFHTGGTERMRIDSSGNVGIGTALPTADLHISYGSGSGLLVEDTTNSPSVKSVVTSGNTESYFGATSNHPLVFLQNNTERMRVDSSGNLLVSKTSATTTDQGVVLRNNGEVYATQDGDKCLVLNRKTSDGQIASFRKDNTEVGSIGTISGDIFVGTGDTTLRFYDAGNAITPRGTNGAANNGVIDLGSSSERFKDLYLSGQLELNGHIKSQRGIVQTVTNRTNVIASGNPVNVWSEINSNYRVSITPKYSDSRIHGIFHIPMNATGASNILMAIAPWVSTNGGTTKTLIQQGLGAQAGNRFNLAVSWFRSNNGYDLNDMQNHVVYFTYEPSSTTTQTFGFYFRSEGGNTTYFNHSQNNSGIWGWVAPMNLVLQEVRT